MVERIEVNTHIHFGKPCVAGTRIPVQSVLELLSEGMDFETIIRDYYPDLKFEDIRACIRYAMLKNRICPDRQWLNWERW